MLILNIKDLEETIEKRIIDKYKKKFVGVFLGTLVGLSIIGFFGYDIVIKSLENKIIEKLTTGSFKDNVIKQVTLKIDEKSHSIYDEIASYEKKAKKIVEKMEEDHEDLVDSATVEFKRTIEVLNKVRKRHEDK